MLTDQWFPDGIVVRGARSGVVEKLPEPYSLESATRLARTYAALWLEPIEWWAIGSEDRPRRVALPMQPHFATRASPRRSTSRSTQGALPRS